MSELSRRRPPRTFWTTASRAPHKGSKTLPIAVAVTPHHLEIKLKTTRKVFRITWNSILYRCIEMEVAAIKRARQEARAAKRSVKRSGI